MGESYIKCIQVEKLRCNLLVGNRRWNKVLYPVQLQIVSALALTVQTAGIYFFGHTMGTRKECSARGLAAL